jgi:hypothetical protein
MLGDLIKWFCIAWGKQILSCTSCFLLRIIEMQHGLWVFLDTTIINCNSNLDLSGKGQWGWYVWGVIKCAGCLSTPGIIAASWWVSGSGFFFLVGGKFLVTGKF